MFPAYSIPLTEKDLILLGELTVILGQVDEEMVRCVSGLVLADRPTTARIMGSTQIANNAAIWASLIGLRTSDLDILWLVDHAQKEIKAVSEGRNDFIHAFYQHKLPTGGYMYWSSNEYAEERPESSENSHAIRVRNSNATPVTELPELHQRAARLSCLMAHITHLLAPPVKGYDSPWLGRLGPTLPPRPDSWQPQSATKIPLPQRSSRGKPQ